MGELGEIIVEVADRVSPGVVQRGALVPFASVLGGLEHVLVAVAPDEHAHTLTQPLVVDGQVQGFEYVGHV